MNQSNTMLNQLMNWVQSTREHSPLLHLEADGLLARLTHLHYRQQQIDALNTLPMTLGLYGESVEGKHHLLKMLAAKGRDEVYVQLGATVINYLTLINHSNTAASIAVRFTNTPPSVVDEAYPLLLTLLTESDLAQRLIHQHQTDNPHHRVPNSVIAATLSELQARRQIEPNAGMTPEQFSSVTCCYHRYLRGPYQLDDHLLHQMAELAPWLSLSDRAELLALLWGKDSALTAQWQQQAQTLQYLGGVTELLAPSSLMTEGFLFYGHSEAPLQNADIIVCPLYRGRKLTCQSLTQQALASVCAEVTFVLSHSSSLTEVELVDIPAHQLSYYQDRLQPDMLLIYDPVAERSPMISAAKSLMQWATQTQSQSQNTMPRLAWAITPFDIRFTQPHHRDDSVQRFMTQSGIRWGTLQALDQRNMVSLQEWLAAALSSTSRHSRLVSLQTELTERVINQFHSIHLDMSANAVSAKQQGEALIRTLQSKAARQGEIIGKFMLPRETLYQCWLQYQQISFSKPAELVLNIDLFDEREPLSQSVCDQRSFASAVYELWVNHLRQLSYRLLLMPSLDLDRKQLQTLCDMLIRISHQRGLQQTLERVLARHDNSAATAITHAANVLNDFVSWLGYNHQAAGEERPMSRVNKSSTIFASSPQASATTRLRSLGEQTQHGNAGYIYDWLVALLTRINENVDHVYPDDISVDQREILHCLIIRQKNHNGSLPAVS